MDSSPCSNSSRLALAVSMTLGWALLQPLHAQTAPALKLSDSGRTRTFELATEEVSVRRAGSAAGDLKAELEKSLPGAAVTEDLEDRVIVKLTAPLDATATRKDTVSRVLPGTEVAPVLYLSGRPHQESTRRIVTSKVLVRVEAGAAAAQKVGTEFKALKVKATNVPALFLLSFETGYQAMDALTALRAGGWEADLQLQRKMERRLVPNDPFFSQQWHLNNLGQSNGLVGLDVNAIPAWDLSLGLGVTIAIVDDGLQLSHPDLAPNCLPLTLPSGVHPHHDFNGFDDDPAPGKYDDHGTSCGGVAAARGGNNIGVSGSAPRASLLGLRLISGRFTDEDSANALYWHPDGVSVDVSSNSWGPPDDAHLEGPDVLTKQSLEDAATLGRAGKGTVTVWAGGNGLLNSDNVNLDGFANSRFVIAVGACTNDGQQSYYSERGSPLLVCAPSSGGTLGIFTTDVTGVGGYNPGPDEPSDNKYTNSFGGTSSATPLVSGGVALLLAANPNLGYRDVQEILATTAAPIATGDSDWVTNGGGFAFNHKFGAGVVDLGAAVARALNWTNLGPEKMTALTLAAPSVPVDIPDNNQTGVTRNFDLSATANLRVEHVEVVLNISHFHRSDLEITLTSPAGTKSVLIDKRPRPSGEDDSYDANGSGWTFQTTHNWGENSAGVWSVRVRDLTAGSTGTILTASLRVYGTTELTRQRLSFETKAVTVNENSGLRTVRIKRLGSLSGTVSVDYQTLTTGTATSGVDYQPVSGTAVFANGQSFVDFTIPIVDDATAEAREAFYVQLSNPVGAVLGGNSQQKIQIADDDGNFVTLRASDTAAQETPVPAPFDTGTFTISRTAAESTPLTVHYTVSGSAQAGVDYTALSGTAVIPAGQASVDVVIKPIEDSISEGAETVVLTIDQSATYGVGLPDSALVNIFDNDLPSVQITAVATSIPEDGDPGIFRISRGKAFELPLTVLLRVSGPAKAQSQYVPLPERVEIPANAASVDVLLVPVNDNVYTANKQVNLDIAASPDYEIGFQDQASMLIAEDEPVPDRILPTVLISTPAADARIVESPGTPLTAIGTAKDNGTVTRIRYRLNGNDWEIATGTATWHADLSAAVHAGPNLLEVTSVDDAGNTSPVIRRAFRVVRVRQLDLTVVGSGTVTTGFAGITSRDAGEPLTVTATPAAGFVFAGWRGDLQNNARRFTFTMPDAATNLRAEFIQNPFIPAVTGAYQGLVTSGDGFVPEQSGAIQLKLTGSGTFTGALTFNGIKYPLKGEFTGESPEAGKARYIGTIVRKKALPLTLDLVVDVDPAGTGQLTGVVSTPDFVSTVAADRAHFQALTNPYAPAALKPVLYTLVLPALDGIGSPRGNGFGTLSINSAGVVKLRAILPDATSVSYTTALSKSLGWPLFLKLYSGKGLILGPVVLDPQDALSDLHASLDWIRPLNNRSRFFPSGFTVKASLLGSIYTPPATGLAILASFAAPAGPGTIVFQDGNLKIGIVDRAFSATLTQSPIYAPLVTDRDAAFAEKVKLSFAPKSGLFSGSFIHPVTRRSTALGGVLFQRQQKGFGLFRGSSSVGAELQTGSVTITNP